MHSESGLLALPHRERRTRLDILLNDLTARRILSAEFLLITEISPT